MNSQASQVFVKNLRLSKGAIPEDEDRNRAMSSIKTALAAGLLVFGFLALPVSAQGINGEDVVFRLRLAGDDTALTPMRSCLVGELKRMPDVKVETVPAKGVRFILDVDVAQSPNGKISASILVVQTFPMEEFRPRIKDGEDKNALLSTIRYYTLTRLHEIIPLRSPESLCRVITADIAEKVLSKEYTERDD